MKTTRTLIALAFALAAPCLPAQQAAPSPEPATASGAPTPAPEKIEPAPLPSPPDLRPSGGTTAVAADAEAADLSRRALEGARPKGIPRGAMELTLEKAMSMAMAQNPDILKALQEIERTHGLIMEVRAQALPRATAGSRYDVQDDNLLSQRLFGPSQNESWQVSLEVRQLIYSGGQVAAALRIAGLTSDSAYYGLLDTVERTIETVRTQFAEIILGRALIGVQQESIALLEQELEDQKNRYEAGTVPRFNVLRAEVELANAQPDLIRAKNDYLIAQLRLAKTLGVDHRGKTAYDQPFEAEGDLAYVPHKVDLAEATQLAVERRPFLKVQRLSIYSEIEQIKVALGGYKPRLDVAGGYEWKNDMQDPDVGTTLDGWYAGLQGSWAIFDGLETAGKVKQSRAKLESARVVYEDSLRQVELEVQGAYSKLREAEELIQSQQKNVEQALEALRLARERFAAGAGTQLDVLDARVALTEARTTELQARYDYVVARATFDRVTSADTVFREMFKDPQAAKPPRYAAEAATTPAPSATPRRADRTPASSPRATDGRIKPR